MDVIGLDRKMLSSCAVAMAVSFFCPLLCSAQQEQAPPKSEPAQEEAKPAPKQDAFTPALSFSSTLVGIYRDGDLGQASGLSDRSDYFATGLFKVGIDCGPVEDVELHATVASQPFDSATLDNTRLGTNNITMFVETAYLRLARIFATTLSVAFGIQHVKWDLRSEGDPIFLDVINANAGVSSAAINYTTASVLSPTRRTQLEPAGIRIDYSLEIGRAHV
jgi:hypothetical protein